VKLFIQSPAATPELPRALTRAAAFTLLEVVVATSIMAIGFLGLFATVLSAGKMASAAEEEAMVASGLEQRIDQLRLLEWPELTDGTGITAKVWTARPEAMAGITVSQESFTISPCDVPGTQTLNAAWSGVASPTTSFTAGTALSGASTVKAVATLTWTGRRSKRPQTRSLVTVISRGGLSKSDRP
jgi:type II secretory pathway pseudopilin PulG